MATWNRGYRCVLSELVLCALVGLLLAVPASVRGAGGDDDQGAVRMNGVNGADEPRDPLPPGTTPATRHEVTLVPAGPEDPEAPAETFTDPPETPAGDESANLPIPDYLKGNPYRLSFVTGDYFPPQDERIDPLLLAGIAQSFHRATYGYVMFEGAIQDRKVQALADLGVAFMNYHTFNSLQAWIPERALAGLRVSPHVRWVGYARPEQKVDEFILEELMKPGTDPTEELPIFVNTFVSDLGASSALKPIFKNPPPPSNDPREAAMTPMIMMPNGPFHQAIEEARGRVIGYEDSIQTFYVWATRDTVRRLMKLDFVAGMDIAHRPTLDHDRSVRQISADYMGGLSAYSGKDTAVAICDSGFHHAHSDLSQTYSVYWDLSGENNGVIDNCGHGTHVAGTVLGDGSARSDRRFRGCAPAAGTVQAYSVRKVKLFKGSGCVTGSGWPNYAITGWTNTRSSVTSPWSANKCTVVQNSWGNGGRLSTGYYGTDSLSRAVDTNTHSYRQTYVMSSGNMGGDSSVQYYKSNRPPSVSKSALAVANLMDYDNDSGTKYGGRYPGAAAYSSSKGPTRDGRVKPQVGAPGTWIVSALTNSTTGYTSKRGTSMAAPHVSGIAAQMHDGSSSTYRDYPCLTRAKIMAAAQPYAGTRTTSQSSESSYNRRGMGTADAYATVYQRNVTDGWMSGWARANLTRSSSGFYFDITIPSDATRTFFVMSWDEKAPALNATKAVLYNLDLVLDVEPFSSDINVGEYTSRSTVENYDWYGNVGSISAIRGKKVRVKVPFLTKPSILFPSEVVRVGVGYHVPRGDYTPAATVSMVATPDLVKPGATLTATGTATIADYRADSLYMYLSASGFSVSDQKHVTRDGRTLSTKTATSSTDSLTDWTLGMVGDFWSSTHRRLVWTLKAPATSKTYRIYAYARGTGTSTASGSDIVCVDGLAPNRATNVRSTTHTPNVWTNRRPFTAAWTAASDNGCAGMQGYGYRYSTNGCSTPTSRNLGNVTTTSTSFGSTTGTRWYFNLRSFDRLDNASSSTCIGPFLVDTVAPVAPSSLKSTTHAVNAWTNYAKVTMTWVKPPAASNESPIRGYSYLWSTSSSSTPNTSMNSSATSYTTTLPSGNWYFHARALDQAGNWGPAAHAGPYRIDTISPVNGNIVIAGGAATTRSLVVSLGGLTATEAHSGLGSMRFSNNGSTWSPWQTYATTRSGWNLGSFGGNTAAGTKRTWVQYRDRAGNVSPISAGATDTIVFDPLDLTSVSPSRGPLIGGETVTVTGYGFKSGSTQVFFDGVPATAVNVSSLTSLTCVTPTHLTWEKVNVRVAVGSYSETRPDAYEYVGGNILAVGNPRLATPFKVVFNAPVDGGRQYVGAASLGAGPIPLPPHNPLGLSPDILWFLTINNLIPTIYANTAGILDGSGQATVTVTQPDIPALVGLTFYMAYVTIQPSKPLGIRTVSSNRAFKILPK